MNRRHFALTLAAAVLAGGAAFADPMTDSIVDQLRRQGYDEIHIGRTLLGRVRITAVSPNHSREIIFNPRTGEILRDYAEGLRGAPDKPQIIREDGDGGGGSSGSGSGADGGSGGGSDDGGGDHSGSDGGGSDSGAEDSSDSSEHEDSGSESSSDSPEDHGGDDETDDSEDK